MIAPQIPRLTLASPSVKSGVVKVELSEVGFDPVAVSYESIKLSRVNASPLE